MQHKVFISYHHGNDAAYKDALLRLNALQNIFIDGSVDVGEIGDHVPDTRVREIIRDEYLRDSTVTIVLVGTGTAGRKHVDWEIYSSMFDGARNRKSGVLVVMLPMTGCSYFTSAHDGEKELLYPDWTTWITIDQRDEYERRYPFMPDRIIDNLLAPKARISVTTWDRAMADPSRLRFLIEAAWQDWEACEYDLSRAMRRNNS